jgi:type I restriction enzyme S subunit
MSMKLEEFARESRATHKGDKSGVPIVGLEHLIPQEIKFSGYDVDTENTFTKTFKKGQILFGRRRAYLKKAAIADFDGICSGDITVIEAIPGKVDPLLLPFIIQNDKFFDYAVSRSAGGLSPRVKWEHLKDYEFDLPPIEEQRILADKLWAAYRLKESYKKLLTATQEMVKSQFIEMFKGDNQVPLGDICNIEKGATITRNDVLPGEVPVVAGGQEPSCYHNVANREAGAITVSASGAYAGYINFWNCPIFASDCNTIISKDDEKTDQTFVYFGLRAMQKQIYGLQKGGAQPHVYGKDLQKFMFPCPSYAKQIEFSKMAKQADKSEFELRKSIEAIDQVIKSLINN